MKFISDLSSSVDLVLIKGQNAVVRVDLNIPSNNDPSRIYAIKDTVSYLVRAGMRVVLISHYKRPSPQDFFTEKYSLKNIVKLLSDILESSIDFKNNNLLNSNVQIDADITLLENIRFYPEEEKNDMEFARRISSFGKIYINEAFSVSHRSHASIDAITRFLPHFAGFSFEKEIRALEKVTQNIERPYTAIIGGSKVSSKIDVLSRISKTADNLIITGAMANTFLRALGHNMGQSFIEEGLLPVACEIMKTSMGKIILPIDFLVSEDINHNGIPTEIDCIPSGSSCFDIGPRTVNNIKNVLDNSRLLLWNGALGAFEFSNFDISSKEISSHIASLTSSNKLISIIGGGETIASAEGYKDKMTHFSTAGGAFLDFISGKKLPGLRALEI